MKNFKVLETEESSKPEKELKKTRTKKFIIKDRVNLDKPSFEECPINVLTKIDINKTIAVPSKIDRLEKMKDFFTKNRSKNGKLVVPKKLSFMNDFVISNFGSTQIYDYDDNKDIVGSRRDFASFSFYINPSSGELQSDLENSNENDFPNESRENSDSRAVSPDCRGSSPMDWTRPETPVDLHILSQTTSQPGTSDPESTPLSNINIIDEGIEVDAFEKSNMLLPVTSPADFDILRLFLLENESAIDPKSEFEPVKLVEESQTEQENPPEVQIKNIFMVPLKKLKHRCVFDLPFEEYGEMKRMKKDQGKGSAMEPMRQARLFNPFEQMRQANITCHPEDPPFLGFTKAQQCEPMTKFSYKFTQKPSRDRSRSPMNVSDDIEMTMDEDINLSGTEVNSSCDQTSLNVSCDQNKYDSLISNASSNVDQTSTVNTTEASQNTSVDTMDESTNVLNVSGGDSCYQSLASGDSVKHEMSSFFKDIESRNTTIVESEEKEDEVNESDEIVKHMRQSAANVSS